jgi:hypothetical protein
MDRLQEYAATNAVVDKCACHSRDIDSPVLHDEEQLFLPWTTGMISKCLFMAFSMASY